MTDRPKYKLHDAVFLEPCDTAAGASLHPKDAIVEYQGEPSRVMQPLNDEAWRRFHATTERRMASRDAPLESRRDAVTRTRYPFEVKPRA